MHVDGPGPPAASDDDDGGGGCADEAAVVGSPPPSSLLLLLLLPVVITEKGMVMLGSCVCLYVCMYVCILVCKGSMKKEKRRLMIAATPRRASCSACVVFVGCGWVGVSL